MKRMKKFASFALALIMALAMTTTAFAADNLSHTITVTQNTNDQTAHIYEAYQIFKGDLSGEGTNKVLSNIEWGSGVNGNALLSALQSDVTFNVVGETTAKTNAFAECTNAAEVAAVLADTSIFQSSDTSSSTLTDTFARLVEENLTTVVAGTNAVENSEGAEVGTIGDASISVTGSGYYLIKDRNGSVNGTEGAYSRFMLEVVGDASATVKSEVPDIEKSIKTENGNTDANTAGVGNVVSYEIKGKVPNMTGYDYYFYVISDTLSEGLTFNNDIVVKVGGTEVEAGQIAIYSGDQLKEGEGTFKVAFTNILNDFKDKEGAEISVTYSATVNSAALTVDKNTNEATLIYSNNPNKDYDGTEEEDRPGLPDSSKDVPTGETEKKITVTYLAKINIVKIFTDKNTDLPGATFTLTGTSKQYVLKGGSYYVEDVNGTYYLLKNGTYTSTPPTINSYMVVSSSTTAGYVEAEADYDGHDSIIAKSSNAGDAVTKSYRPYNKDNDTEKTVYKLMVANEDVYADTVVKYRKVDAAKNESVIETYVNWVGTTDENGQLSFEGLGEGEYTLEETGVPEGYNKAENVTIKISFTKPDDIVTGSPTWNITGSTENVSAINGNGNIGVYTANIINNKGSLLPSTGGIGTTIFYVVGGILVIGAGVLLVAKKRMGKR